MKARSYYPVAVVSLVILVGVLIRSGAPVGYVLAGLAAFAVSWFCAGRTSGGAGLTVAMLLAMLAGSAVLIVAARL